MLPESTESVSLIYIISGGQRNSLRMKVLQPPVRRALA
jgi:hypothetical protein